MSEYELPPQGFHRKQQETIDQLRAQLAEAQAGHSGLIRQIQLRDSQLTEQQAKLDELKRAECLCPACGADWELDAPTRCRRLIVEERFAYELSFGRIPEDKLLMHRCDNPSCVNPVHLTPGTDQENTNDKIAKGRDGANKKAKRIPMAVADAIRAEFAAGVPRKVLYAKYDVCQRTFRRIVLRERLQDKRAFPAKERKDG